MLALAAAVSVVVLASFGSIAHISNDGAQYLSTIRQLLAGNGLKTTTVYYEVQAQFGLPAVQTVWPPLLPLAAASMTWISGVRDISAIALTSALAHGATALVLFAVLRALSQPQSHTPFIVSGCYLLYGVALKQTLVVSSEPLFTLFLVGAAASLHRAARVSSAQAWLLIASLCVACACATRYSGIAFIGALGVVAAIGLWRDRFSWASLKNAVILLAAPVLTVAGLLARNLFVSGVLTGGPTASRGLTGSELLAQSKWAVLEVFGGGGPLTAKLLIVALIVLFAAFLWFQRAAAIRAAEQPAHAGELIAFCFTGSVLTIALIFGLALRPSGVAIEGRYFTPLVPLLLIGFAAFFATREGAGSFRIQTRLAACCLACLGALTLVNIVEFRNWLRVGGTAARLETILAQDANGRTARESLASSASPARPILSNQSQALHAVLGRPTIGVPERRLTAQAWTADEIVALARRFKAQEAVVFRTLPLGAPDGADDFVWRMATTPHPALRSKFLSNDLAIIEISDDDRS
jgi:Dolichyl-phosphate-mannose-protein mannosyltransferase